MFEIYSTVTKKKKTQKTSIFIFSKIVLHILLTFVCWSTREQGWAKKKTEHYKPFFLKDLFFLKKNDIFCFVTCCITIFPNKNKKKDNKAGDHIHFNF